jgi:hypothetical protein
MPELAGYTADASASRAPLVSTRRGKGPSWAARHASWGVSGIASRAPGPSLGPT